jgi:hypothetical protein
MMSKMSLLDAVASSCQRGFAVTEVHFVGLRPLNKSQAIGNVAVVRQYCRQIPSPVLSCALLVPWEAGRLLCDDIEQTTHGQQSTVS